MEVVGNGFKLAVLALSLLNDFSMILIRVETAKVRGPQFLKLLGTLLSSDSVKKMEGDLASLVEMYHLTKKSGLSAKLILSSKRGAATIAKLEIELDDATPSLSTSTTQSSTPAPGKQ